MRQVNCRMARGRSRASAGIIRVLRQARSGHQSDEQGRQSQGVQNAWRLGPRGLEGSSRICGEVHGVTDCQNEISLFQLKLSDRGASIIAPRRRDHSERVVGLLPLL